MPKRGESELEIIKPGLVGYDDALALQEERRALRAAEACPDALFLLEHPPVITLGRRADPANLLASPAELEKKGVAVRSVNRGGDVTFHGPGQLLGYPVISLRGLGLGVKDYVVALETALVSLLRSDYGMEAEREEGKFTGVWTERGKVAAIGVGVSGGVTIHGFALNVNTDLSWFKLINPCGIVDRPVTSMRELLGRELDLSAVMDRAALRVRQALGYA
jgi:lipoyl(octanoyl) transferase